jgi:PAB-dependent poly(A)-specific ribonuclease subunit 2
MISTTTSLDARNFHADYKEPCILYYREVTLDGAIDSTSNTESETSIEVDMSDKIDDHSHYRKVNFPKNSFDYVDDPPDADDLIAFDAEFVQVQPEYSLLTTSGQKRLIHEGRNVLARMSLIDCRSGRVLCDDYIRPLEPVTDYLTRFSGIRPGDLDPNTSTHRLISHRSAYLQVRSLVDR